MSKSIFEVVVRMSDAEVEAQLATMEDAVTRLLAALGRRGHWVLATASHLPKRTRLTVATRIYEVALEALYETDPGAYAVFIGARPEPAARAA